MICGWKAERILLTQIGRSAPHHEELMRVVEGLCAYDGLEFELA